MRFEIHGGTSFLNLLLVDCKLPTADKVQYASNFNLPSSDRDEIPKTRLRFSRSTSFDWFISRKEINLDHATKRFGTQKAFYSLKSIVYPLGLY
jgi:hypothetical protein